MKWYLTVESMFFFMSLIYTGWNLVDGEYFLALMGMVAVFFFGNISYHQYQESQFPEWVLKEMRNF